MPIPGSLRASASRISANPGNVRIAGRTSAEITATASAESESPRSDERPGTSPLPRRPDASERKTARISAMRGATKKAMAKLPATARISTMTG